MQTHPSAKQAVLVLHGFTAEPRTVDFLIPFLKSAGFETALPVLRGHASRPEDMVGVRWQDWLADASTAFEDLARNHEQVSVVGHSMGAVVAAHFAAQNQTKIHKLVLVSPAIEFSNPAVKVLPLLGKFVKFWKAGPASIKDPSLRAEFIAKGINYQRFPVAAFTELFNLGALVKTELAAIQCPTLVLHGRLDSVIPTRAAEFVLSNLGSKNKRILWLEQSDHEIFWDAERENLCQYIVEFLKQSHA